MMSLMESVLCEATAAPLVLRATSSAPPWASMNPITGHMTLSPDTGQSDAASNSSYVISSSSGLIDPTRDTMKGSILQACTEMEMRDSSPQSTSYDGYDHIHFLDQHKKTHANKPHRDPTSHRIIEKRRRDRMNNCLTNLSKLIPSVYLKKGRGRIEKTEIIEMAIRYMKHIELERRQQKREHMELQQEIMLDKSVGTDEDDRISIQGNLSTHTDSNQHSQDTQQTGRKFCERYKQGFFDCIAETLRFLAGAEGFTVNDQMKTRLLFHLREYFGRLADCESQQNSNIKTFNNATNGHLRQEDNDEPLNMSLKRPRTSSSPSRYAQSNGEIPCSSSVSSSGCGESRHHGSQLRDILETKEPFPLIRNAPSKYGTPKSEPTLPGNRQPPQMHLPHSAMPSMFTQKFSATNSAVDQKQNLCGITSGGSSTDCNGRSISGLLSSSAASSFGGRSTSSSNATTTSQYPSSPGSSINSFAVESPAGLHSPASPHSTGFPVPIFALHPIGLFYVPLTVNSQLLDATFSTSVLLCGGGDHASSMAPSSAPLAQQMTASALSSVTHPVTINVNFNFLPNMANAMTNAQQQHCRAVAARIANVCNGSAVNANQNGVILNTANYESNLRIALKQ